MSKQLEICIVVAAIAAFAALPATASASNGATLTQPTGTSLTPTHESTIPLVAKTVGPTRSTDASGNVLTQCATGEARGNLETNTHTAIEGTITEAKVWGTAANHASPHCESPFGNTTLTTGIATNGLPWCVRITNTMATDTLQLRGNSCTQPARPIRAIWHIAGVATCTYERTTPIEVVYPTHPKAAEGTGTGIQFSRVEGSFLCPVSMFLDLTLAVFRETPGGTLDPIYIDKAP